jgi:hypothetical protein
MHIQVFRPKQFVDIVRDYKLFADGIEVAIIKRGASQTVVIHDSTQSLTARIDWCSSQSFPVSSITEKGLVIKNSFGSNVFKLVLLPLYYITFGKNRYLSIESRM